MRLLLLAGIVYALVAIPVGVRRGGDLEAHFTPARLWLEGLPLYARPPHAGVWWPPLAVLLVVPFALAAQVSAALAKAAWAAGGVACIGWSVAHLPRDRWRPVALALIAVAVPLHRNFEDLNLNAILLASLVAAAGDLARGRDGERRAGIWIGIAAALKVFPILWFFYLAARRHWRGLAIAVVVAAGSSVAPLLRYGVPGAFDAIWDWVTNSAPVAWAPLGSNQSLAALATRLHVAPAGTLVLDATCVTLGILALRQPKVVAAPFEELAVVGLVAVLVSPIAWVHYFLFALPVWVVALRLRPLDRPLPWSIALLLAGVATSGIATVWSLSLRRALFDLSVYTWGALLLLVVAAFAPRHRAGTVAPD